MRPRPWLMLAVGVTAQTATTIVTVTPAFLIPLLHTERGLSLAQAGLLAAAPNLGLVLALILWGAATDRWGERVVLVTGLVVTTLALVGALFSEGYVALGVLFVLVGVGAASTNAASGRVVIGWFPKQRRGLAMGIRQTCQPLGVAIAALVVPALVADGSVTPALWLGIVVVALSALLCAVVIVNPPRPARTDADPATANPYRTSGALLRIHAVSALLVVPQFGLSTFGLIWLVADQGWSTVAAGILVAIAQFLGALGRIGAGVLSDRVGSRLRPLRWVAIAALALLLFTALASWSHVEALVAVSYVLASCVTVADNGLAFTAVAEIAGPHWSGRALGTQNTGQFLMAAITAPVVGALIGVVGYAAGFALVALAPAIATPLIPRAAVVEEPATR